MSKKWGGILLSLFVLAGWLMLNWRTGEERIAAAEGEGLIRLHILANSDSPEDQRVKLAVRDAVIAYLAPMLTKAGSQKDAKVIVAAHQKEIVAKAEEVLRQNGVDYSASMETGVFNFPIRSYGTIIVPAGKYETVRILLGNAVGHNWWCVLFPPLCLVDGTSSVAVTAGLDNKGGTWLPPNGVEFKWKIAELWNELKQGNNGD